MIKRLYKTLYSNEKGITGLETAIVLIAFVVVASVFAYTVLSAGIYSSQKGHEATHTALDEVKASLELKSYVVARKQGNVTAVGNVTFTVTTNLRGEAIDLTCPTDADSDGLADSVSTNVAVISYISQGVAVDNLAWSKEQLGKSDNDDLLESGEMFIITVDLTGIGENIGTYHTFTIEVKPQAGSTLIIERTTPANLNDYMILY
ncbi:MAG: archaellin/type IV pilin N-terminal domain-containing protein [Chloroflexota bacterium]|nr:archaellin/type IV pilin N-terminal domain-containing protein [Chloroflexota bacterium]